MRDASTAGMNNKAAWLTSRDEKQESEYVQPVVKDEGKECECTWSQKCVYCSNQHNEACCGKADL